MLLSLGARLDIINNKGETPLHAVAINGNYRVATTLLKYGGARIIESRNDEEFTCIAIAEKLGNKDLIQLFKTELENF